MADCPLSLGDLTGEGGSPGMEQTVWERADSGGRGTRQLCERRDTTTWHPAHRTVPSAPSGSVGLKLTLQDLEMRMQGKARRTLANIPMVKLPVGGQPVSPGCSHQELMHTPANLSVAQRLREKLSCMRWPPERSPEESLESFPPRDLGMRQEEDVANASSRLLNHCKALH